MALRQVIANDDSRISQLRVCAQPHFNFSQFHAMATYFYLAVIAPQIGDVSIWQNTTQIPTAIDAAVRILGVGNEALFCQVRPV